MVYTSYSDVLDTLSAYCSRHREVPMGILACYTDFNLTSQALILHLFSSLWTMTMVTGVIKTIAPSFRDN